MNGLCSHERLELALAGTLNADEESTLHLHLEDCELCAAEMERLSGGEQASREIAALLVHDELDDALKLREECFTPSTPCNDSMWLLFQHDSRDAV